MTIQIIGSAWGSKPGFTGIEQSELANPKSLDEFDVNIIDLSCENLWRCNKNSYFSVDQSNNLISVQQMVRNCTKAEIIYVLPRSVVLHYYESYGKYLSSIMIKDVLLDITKHILSKAFFPALQIDALLFENTRTEINGVQYEADFYFKKGMQSETKSKLSNKTTTVSLNDRVMATTLDVTSSKEKLMNFIDFFFADDEVPEQPNWMTDISFYDDSLQKEIITEREAEIGRAQKAIEEANSKLQENNQYKSILYTNGAQLVEVVFDILEQLLHCDLSDFEDKKNEDFLIHLDNCTLIGEIKGVTSNVKNDHIGQIEHHYQRYMDELDEKGISENVHQVLIISPFRTKAPNTREPVHEKQINLAKRNGCLIIETSTLLKVFECYLEGRTTSEKCIEVFCNKTGLLQISDISTEQQGELEHYKI